jgi:hypothetical protein
VTVTLDGETDPVRTLSRGEASGAVQTCGGAGIEPSGTNFAIRKRKAGAISAISMVLAAPRARGKRDTVLARSECKTWRKTADGMGAFASKRTRKHRI